MEVSESSTGEIEVCRYELEVLHLASMITSSYLHPLDENVVERSLERAVIDAEALGEMP